MLKIAICDDEQPIRDYLKKLTEKCTDAQVHVFANGEELLSDPTVYDIILLDISLNRKPDSGKPNGMEVAKKIRETSDVIIIFVTALKEYVFEGYDDNANIELKNGDRVFLAKQKYNDFVTAYMNYLRKA